ncbi:Uncharacterized protein FWK35_00007005 [Aphis craccivora]|uniref:Uncharacterized protein n=1 Tax=Aphis craccivora TaxID=307492 RepID=A0A6G0Z1L9_APHCR|nr:Uncharacterized protein FWK35_00007005 [Aphis craccivora]
MLPPEDEINTLILYKVIRGRLFSNVLNNLTNSERSDECIDFTILCFFSLYTRTCRNNASISLTLGVVSDSKMNLVGALGRSFFEFSNSFQKHREKPKKKIKEKRKFLRKTSFRQN